MSRALRLGKSAVASASAASSSSRSCPTARFAAAVAARGRRRRCRRCWSARRGLARREAAPNAPRGLGAPRPIGPLQASARRRRRRPGQLERWHFDASELAAAAPPRLWPWTVPPGGGRCNGSGTPRAAPSVEPPTLPLALLRGVLPLPPTCGRPLKTIASIAALTGCPPLEPRAVRSPRAPPLAGGWGGALPP